MCICEEKMTFTNLRFGLTKLNEHKKMKLIEMKNLSYFLYIFCTFSFLSFCNSKQKNPVFDENMIKIISENPIYLGNPDTPPMYAFTIFFVQGDSGKILLLDPRELEDIYNEDYSSWNYKKFVRKALNQKLIIKTKNKGKAFLLDKDVKDNYLNNDLTDFRLIYCDNTLEKDRCWLKYDIPEHQLYSIFYYYFINNYFTWFDDFLGSYSIEKTSCYTDIELNTLLYFVQ